MAATFRVNKDNSEQWYWVLYAGNGEAIARSSEGYTTRDNCLHSIKIVKEQAPGADVFDHSKKPVELVRNLP